MVIAIVALVVLGPERLPEVMRRVGQFYRQAREMAAQYTSEAQRMFDEGMREVEDVSSTINSAWQDATADAGLNQPPPRLRQLPPPVQAPSTTADAGPWMLAAMQRDTSTDREPQATPAMVTPFALPRLQPADGFAESLSGMGKLSSMGPRPTETELAELDAIMDELPPDVPMPELPLPLAAEPAPQDAPEVTPTVGPSVSPARAGLDAPPLLPNGVASTAHANGAHSTVPSLSSVTGMAAGPQELQPAGSAREQTVIELYLRGDITWHKAAEFLNLSPAELLDRVERARHTGSPR